MFHYSKLKDDIINWEGVSFPAGNRDVGRLEVDNEGLLSIKFFETNDMFNEETIIKTRATKAFNTKYHIDLLIVFCDKDRYHYAVNKKLSRLLNCQLNKDNNKTHFCRHCSHPFCKKEGLEEHYRRGCLAIAGQQFNLLPEGSFIDFEKYNTKSEYPFVIYGDVECLTVTSSDGIKGTYQEHKPCGYMLNVVNRVDKTSTPYLYRGKDCMDESIEQLGISKSDMIEKIDLNMLMVISEEEELEFRNATKCSICNKKFDECDEKVRDAKTHKGNKNKNNQLFRSLVLG